MLHEQLGYTMSFSNMQERYTTYGKMNNSKTSKEPDVHMLPGTQTPTYTSRQIDLYKGLRQKPGAHHSKQQL